MCTCTSKFYQFHLESQSSYPWLTPLLKHTIRQSYLSGTQQMQISPAEHESAPVYQSWKKLVFH